MKRTFLCGFEMTFEVDEEEAIDNGMEGATDELETLTAKNVEDAVNAGLQEGAYDFFGETLCCMGLATPICKVIDKPE